MAYSVISDLEEFVEYPFGVVDISSVPLGVSSKNGHEMINGHERSSVSYSACLELIVSYINNEIDKELLGVLGYKKQRQNNVVNLVNGRHFSAVDAEHFLCKSWIIAKSNLGQISEYPWQSNHYTHPNPVIHCIGDAKISNIMLDIESEYMNLVSAKFVPLCLPEICRMKGEMFDQKKPDEGNLVDK
jgi:hypothetical protein